MPGKETLEGKVLFVKSDEDVDVPLITQENLKRPLKVIKGDTGSIIQELESAINTGAVHAVVLACSPMDGRERWRFSELKRVIAAARAMGYDDSQLITYSSVSLSGILDGSFIRPYRFADMPYLLKDINKF